MPVSELSHEEQQELIDDIRDFAGRNADYYLKRWAPVLLGRRRLCGFNPAAFVFGIFWFAYRKMYFMIVMVLFISVIMSPIERQLLAWFHYRGSEQTVSTVSALTLSSIAGVFGNRIYLWHALRKIDRVRRGGLSAAERGRRLARVGGVSLVSGLAIPFLVFALVAVAYLLD